MPKEFWLGLIAVVAVSATLPLVIPQPYALLLSCVFAFYAGRIAKQLSGR